MCIIKPSKRYLSVKNNLYSLFFLLLFLLCSFSLKNFKFILVPLSLFLILGYVFIIFIYKPIKFKNTNYKIKKASILIETGFLFFYKIYIPYKAVKYIEKKSNILQKILDVKTINLYTTCNKTSLKNLDDNDAKIIQIKLFHRLS